MFRQSALVISMIREVISIIGNRHFIIPFSTFDVMIRKLNLHDFLQAKIFLDHAGIYCLETIANPFLLFYN